MWTEGDQNRINKLLKELDKALEGKKEKLANKIRGQIRHHYRQKGFKNINVDKELYNYKKQIEEKELIEEGYEMLYDGYSGDFIWVHPDSEEALYYPDTFDDSDIFENEPEIPTEEALQQKALLEATYGVPGTKKMFEHLTLEKMTNGSNAYGLWTLYIWKNDLVTFKWFQSNKKTHLETGTVMNVKGTIKEYKYFNKNFDIMLNRCRLYDTENTEITPQVLQQTERRLYTSKKKKIKKNNKRKKKKSIKCSSCDKIFSSTQARSQHFQAKHESN